MGLLYDIIYLSGYTGLFVCGIGVQEIGGQEISTRFQETARMYTFS